MASRSSPNEAPKKCPWVMRVGVFFDGTGNNKANDRSASKMTNIAKLSERYPEYEDPEKLEQYKAIYKNGVGTVDGDDTEVDGLAKGEGGIERIHEALAEVAEFFDSRPCAKEFIVDVYGFSRGAAQARHFVNEIHDRAAGPNVKVGFVGIYDTVGSFVSSWFGVLGLDDDKPGDDVNVAEWKVQKGTRTVHRGGRRHEVPYYEKFVQPYNFHLSAASADYVEHFVARDEIRKNFPLTSVEPNDGGFLNEQTFIGVHSDIGGGYAPDEGSFENKLEWVAQYRPRHGGRIDARDRLQPDRSRNMVRRERFSTEETEFIRERYEKLGYKINEEIIGTRVWLVGKKEVKLGLANVYLRLMHTRAVMSGVPFLELPSDAEHDVPSELTDFASSVLNNTPFPVEEEQAIYANFVHQSYVDDEDRASIFKPSSYFGDVANEPDENNQRRVFANNSTMAVVPQANDNPNANGAEINTENLSSRG